MLGPRGFGIGCARCSFGCTSKGSARRESVRATQRCAVRGERGTPRRNRHGTSSRFGRSARDALSGERRESGSSPRESPQGEARRQTRRGEIRRPASGRVTTTRVSCPCVVRVAEVVGPLSGSEKRAIGIVRVESPGATPDARGREPSLGGVGARERVGPTLTKGRAVPRRQSDPHHVNARHPGEAAWVSYVLRRVRGVHAALGDGRCLGSDKRAHLSRGGAWKRPWRPPERVSIGDRSRRGPGEATETSRVHSHSSA